MRATLELQEANERQRLHNEQLTAKRKEAREKLARQNALLEAANILVAAENEELSLLMTALQASRNKLAEVESKQEQTRKETEVRRAAAEQAAENHRTIDLEGQRAAEEEEELLRKMEDTVAAGRADAEGKRNERESQSLMMSQKQEEARVIQEHYDQQSAQFVREAALLRD